MFAAVLALLTFAAPDHDAPPIPVKLPGKDESPIYRDGLPRTGEAPGEGMDHFCLSIRCDDLAAVARALEDRGTALEGKVADRRGAFGRGPSLYLRDPDGYKVELKPRS